MGKRDDLGPTQKKLLAALRVKHTPVRAKWLAAELDISHAAAKDSLRRLHRRGVRSGQELVTMRPTAGDGIYWSARVLPDEAVA